jgi:hypothetical protein
MPKGKVTRWRASGLHLLISIAIAAAVLALLLLVWYPGPLFEAMGGMGLLMILVGVDVVLGPAITVIIFKQGKRGLKLDLVIIGTVQLAALFYGVQVMYLARPAFIVFVKDQFQVATAAELEPERLAAAKYPQFGQPPIGKPLFVASDIPNDPVSRSELTNAVMAGLDVQHFPKYYVPYSERTREILAASQPIERIRKTEPETGKIIDAYLARSGKKESDLRYVPLRGRQAWIAALIDARTAEPVKLLLAENM